MADDTDALTMIHPCDRVELSARHIAFDRLEAGSDHIDSCWIAHEEDAIGELLRAKMKVEDGAIAVDDQLRAGDCAFIHHR